MKKPTNSVTHEALQQAIARYLKGGGRIVKLPEQKTISSAMVGRRWSSTEVELDPHR
jgi:hypothetical protein